MAMSWNFCGLLLVLNVLCPGTLGQNYESCPSGWMTYDGEAPRMCVWVSDSSAEFLDDAQSICSELMESNLIVIESEKKFEFFKNFIKNNLGHQSEVWIGLQKYDDTLSWQINEELVEATTLPFGSRYNNWYYREQYNRNGLIYKNGVPQRASSDGSKNHARFFCEKRSSCQKGWFGSSCAKQCQCYGQTCEPSAIMCLHGCHVGWMGPYCTQKKENADVRYFCVDSPDIGKYVQIMIDPKGVRYDNIHAVDEDGQQAPWCNNTNIEDTAISTETIKIFVDDNTIDEIKSGKCAGKIAQDGRYEWQIKIQEKTGLVSRNDQEVHIHCNFSDADTLSMTGKLAIKREKWFMKTGIKRPVEYLEEKKESVELKVIDPSTGLPLAKALIGSPVALQIRFGFTDGSLATGVLPYNCIAASPDNEKKVRLFDEKGCPELQSPVWEFHRNGTKSLITDSFPLFGIEGSTGLEFHCSYTLCFGDDECYANCVWTRENTHNYDYITGNYNNARHRRSAETTSQRLTSHIDVVFEDDEKPGTIPSKEEDQRWPQFQSSITASGNRMPCLGYLFQTVIAFAAVAVMSWSHQ